MLTVKFRHTGRDETLILSAISVQVAPADDSALGAYIVTITDGEGRVSDYEVSNDTDGFSIAYVEGALGATTQVVRPRVRG